MDEILKELLGDNFKENMTKEELQSCFETSIASSGKYVPLAKYTDLETKNKANLQLYNDTKTKLDGIESSNTNQENDFSKRVTELEKNNLEYQKRLAKSEVEKVFAKNSISEEDYIDLLEEIVSTDEEKSVKMAEKMVTMMNKKIKEDVQKGIEEKIKQSGRLPDGENSGNSDEVKTYLENFKSEDSGRTKNAKDFYFKK